MFVSGVVPPVVIWNCEWTSYCHYYEDTASDSIVILLGPGSPMCPADIITSLVLIEFLLYVPLLTHMCLSHLEHGSGPVGICLRLLLEFLDIPILGICLGHQVLISSYLIISLSFFGVVLAQS